ncbi:hypothetical protein ATK17_1761 [Branchiibius hedensis]|uniref:Uncharacterized protein n=1 Tax=Branchiibius hedensis TaxID=672460 RepID=A0A2Y8ZQ06_9MICO|nr:hypothetical protein ATK17_1761 [Branchiibius hedensis]SSA34441.1 hypothetical protein SAMN04489750_1761 [Branchiibius hedensis]
MTVYPLTMLVGGVLAAVAYELWRTSNRPYLWAIALGLAVVALLTGIPAAHSVGAFAGGLLMALVVGAVLVAIAETLIRPIRHR